VSSYPLRNVDAKNYYVKLSAIGDETKVVLGVHWENEKSRITHTHKQSQGIPIVMDVRDKPLG